MSSVSPVDVVPRDDEDQGTPQLSETQSFSVDVTELVTQEFMVPDQLEQDRIRMEEKVSAANERIEEYRWRKSCSGAMPNGASDFSTKLSLPKFNAVCKSLSPKQRGFVADIGQGSLLDICLEEIPRPFVAWIVSNYIASKRMFVFKNGFEFAFNVLCVHKVLGTPIGGRRIPSKCSDQFRDVVRIRSCCEGSTPTINEFMNMLSSDLEEEDFKRYWMMFTVTAFLCPTTYECASPDYLSALEGPSEEIRSYDWSSGVFQKLSVSMKTFVDCGLQGALCGCLVFPLMTYLEYLDIQVKELASVVPRISVWDSETVSQFEKLDLVSAEDGTYGNIPLKDVRRTLFHQSVSSTFRIGDLHPGLEMFLCSFVKPTMHPLAVDDLKEIQQGLYFEIFSAIQPIINNKIANVLQLPSHYNEQRFCASEDKQGSSCSRPWFSNMANCLCILNDFDHIYRSNGTDDSSSVMRTESNQEVAGDTDKNEVEDRLNISSGIPLKLHDNVRKVDAAVANEDVLGKIESDFPESTSKGSGSAAYCSGATMKTCKLDSLACVTTDRGDCKDGSSSNSNDPTVEIKQIGKKLAVETQSYCTTVAEPSINPIPSVVEHAKVSPSNNPVIGPEGSLPLPSSKRNSSESLGVQHDWNDSRPQAMKVILQHSGGFQHKIRENDVIKLREKLAFYMLAFQEAGRDKARFVMDSGEASKKPKVEEAVDLGEASKKPKVEEAVDLSKNAFKPVLAISRITREMLGIYVGRVDTIAEATIGKSNLFASSFVVAAGLNKFLGHSKFLVVDNYAHGSVLVKFQDTSDLQKVDGMVFNSDLVGPFFVTKVYYVQAQSRDYAELLDLFVPKSNF
ncbi:hypothetical protein ACQ4PT_004858 [Festuca glaucescens]